MAIEANEPGEVAPGRGLSCFALKDLAETLTANHILPAVARYKRAVAAAGGFKHGERAAAALHERLLGLLDWACLDARAGRDYTWVYAELAAPRVQPSAAAEAARCAVILAEIAEIRAAAENARRAVRPASPAAIVVAAPQWDPDDMSDAEADELAELYGHFGSREYDDEFVDAGDRGGWA